MVDYSPIVIPPYTPDYLPIPQVTPFTFRDGMSYVERLQALIKYINRYVLPTITEQVNDLGEEFEQEINALIEQVNAAVEAIINDSIQVQDPVVAGIFGNASSLTRQVTDPLYGDHAVNGYFNTPSSETRTVTDVLYAAKTVVDTLKETVDNLPNVYVPKNDLTFNVKDFGAKADGTTDDTASITAAIAAAKDGSKVIFPPGNYAIGTLSNAGKSLNFVADGATFIKDAEVPTIAFAGDYDPFVAVSAISTGTITEHDGSTASLILTTSSVMPWVRGDIVRVISNDVIPGSRDQNNGSLNQMRMGQFFMVYAVSGNTVTLSGTMVDTFTTDIRAGRIKETKVTWQGGTFDVTDSHINNGRKARTFDFTNLVNAEIRNVKIKRTTSVGIAVNGCYNPAIKNVDIRYGLNDLSASPAGNLGLGYAIANFSSQGLRVDGLYAHTVRHGYTDGSGFLPANSMSYAGYGRPLDTVVSNSIVDSASGSAYDTHTSSCHTTITDSIAMNALNLVAFRGRENSAFNLKGVNLRDTALRVFTENNGTSYGHTFDGITVNAAEMLYEAYCNMDSAGVNYMTMDSRPNFVSNVVGRNIRQKGVKAHNSVNYVHNVEATFFSDNATAYALNYYQNTYVYGSNWNYDVGGLSANGALAIHQLDTTTVSRVELNNIIVRGDITSKFQKLVHNGTDAVIRMRNTMLDSAPSSSIVDTLNVGGYVDYQIVAINSNSSALKVLGAADVTDATKLNQLMNSRDPIISVTFNLGANTTFAALPIPNRRGAILVLKNNSAYTATFTNGGTFTAANGADKTVASGKSLMLVGDTGTWRELALA